MAYGQVSNFCPVPRFVVRWRGFLPWLEAPMGRRGPRPTPTKVLQLRGTYRADRHGAGDDLPALSRVPRPPASLSATARREWRIIGKRLHDAELLTAQDLPSLEAYCVVRARALEAEAVVAMEGRTITTPQGMKRHPELVTAEKAWDDCRRYEQLFGLSPSARRGLGIQAPTKQPQNAFSELTATVRKGPA